MNSTFQQATLQSIVSMAVVCLCSMLSAQESRLSPSALQEVETNLSSIQQLVIELDATAESCMASEPHSEECASFSSAINGDFLSQYIEQCRTLKNWRADLADETATGGIEPQMGQQILEQVMEIELRCGEDALISRTDFVLAAWNKIRNPGGISSVTTTLSNQATADARNHLLNYLLNHRMRSSLLNGVDSQQQRLQAETQQLWQRLELENIRQSN